MLLCVFTSFVPDLKLSTLKTKVFFPSVYAHFLQLKVDPRTH